jgi:hypothetical protein
MKFSFNASFPAIMNKMRVIVEETQTVVELTNQQTTSFSNDLPSYSATLFIDAERAFRTSMLGTITQQPQVIVGSLQTKTLSKVFSTSSSVVVGSGKTFKPPNITDSVSVSVK